MAKNQVTLTFAGDSKALERSFDRVGDSSARMTRQVGQASDDMARTGADMGATLMKVGAAAGVAALAVGAAAVKFGVEMYTLSKSIGDLDKKAAVVFEGQLPAMSKWAEANKKAFGTSSRNVLAMAANLADLLKPMGFTAKQAADMSQKTLGLAGALAKWSGGTRTTAEVTDILTSAMLGERDALKGLGISISEADIQARLAKNGAKDLTGAALEQATALATQQLIFEKSTDAQKAWADGGKTAAEKQGALSSMVDTIKEKVAKLLTPAFEAATTTVATWADQLLIKFDEVAPKVQGFVDTELSDLKVSLNDLKDNVLTGVKHGFDDIKESVDANSDSWRKLGGSINGLVKVAGPVLQWLIEAVATSVGAALDWVASLIDALKTAWDWWGKLINGPPEKPSVQAPGPATGRPLQKFHSGGVVQGAPGTEVMALLQAGERVTPAGASGGRTVLELRSSGSRLDDLLIEILAEAIGKRGGNVQVVIGRG